MAEILKKAARPATHVAPLRVKKKAEDPTVRTYRVLIPLQVADESGAVRSRQFGDFVPEAESWKNIGIYLRTQQIEIAYVNRSELEAWQDEFAERCAQLDEDRAQAEAEEIREQELREELRKLEEKRALKEKNRNSNVGNGSARGVQQFSPEPTVEEKIDFGGVKSRGGIPRPAEMPKAPDREFTREVPQQKNVGENRERRGHLTTRTRNIRILKNQEGMDK